VLTTAPLRRAVLCAAWGRPRSIQKNDTALGWTESNENVPSLIVHLEPATVGSRGVLLTSKVRPTGSPRAVSAIPRRLPASTRSVSEGLPAFRHAVACPAPVPPRDSWRRCLRQRGGVQVFFFFFQLRDREIRPPEAVGPGGGAPNSPCRTGDESATFRGWDDGWFNPDLL